MDNPPVEDTALPEARGGQAMGFAVAQAEDKSWWVMITHQSGTMSFTWGLPLDKADEHADNIAAAIRETAAQGRRDRAGFVIADATGVNPNGNRTTRRNARRLT